MTGSFNNPYFRGGLDSMKNLKFLFFLSFVSFFICCRHKKTKLTGEEPVKIGDFIEFFQPANFPYSFADSNLQKKEKDSTLISYKVFTQFVPDSMLNKVFGKTSKLKIYPMARLKGPNSENYLFAKVVNADKKAAFVLCFDKKQNYVTGMPILRLNQFPSTSQSVVVDKRYEITRNMVRKNEDGSSSEGKDVYVLNEDAKNFMLIMTDALDDKATEIINPIDTFSKKNKFSGDYVSNKMNLVSIRDGRKNDRVSFFVHFEKNNGDCTGELKGEARLIGANEAEYRESGESCVLRLVFTPSSVSLREQGCGSHRGLHCVFDGMFMKKKSPKAIKKKSPGK